MTVRPNLIMIGTNDDENSPEYDMEELTAMGRKFTIGYEDGLYREERTASGKLRRDVLAYKRVFNFDYETIETDTVDQLEELYELGQELKLHIFYGGEEEPQKFTVLMSPFSRARLVATHGGIWTGASVVFREV